MHRLSLYGFRRVFQVQLPVQLFGVHQLQDAVAPYDEDGEQRCGEEHLCQDIAHERGLLFIDRDAADKDLAGFQRHRRADIRIIAVCVELKILLAEIFVCDAEFGECPIGPHTGRSVQYGPLFRAGGIFIRRGQEDLALVIGSQFIQQLSDVNV